MTYRSATPIFGDTVSEHIRQWEHAIWLHDSEKPEYWAELGAKNVLHASLAIKNTSSDCQAD